jgi:hypothetical protein
MGTQESINSVLYPRQKLFQTQAASPQIKALLENGHISISSISRRPFEMEDVFISLVEEHGNGEKEGA